MVRAHIFKAGRMLLLAGLAAVFLPFCGALILGPRLEIALDADARCVSASHIVDRDGRLLHTLVDPETGLHEPVALEQIPEYLRWAVVATEDASFYNNPGIDPKGILRAAVLDVRAGRIVAGGSTITQQVARTLVLGRDAVYERTWQRKLQEMALALQLSARLSKDEILSLYLNESYFGNLAYGAEAAAQTIFGKPVAQLDLAECALLAGVLQAPSYYDPFTNLESTRQRQQTVLVLMAKQGYITAAEADLAGREPLRFASPGVPALAPHACVLAQTVLGELVDPEALAQGGLTIQTTLVHDLQALAEDQVALQLALINRDAQDDDKVDNAAALVLDAGTGAIYAMVGSPDYSYKRIDGAVNACLTPRQPGSALKPLTYALAFERGASPATVVADVRTAYVTREGQPYVPVNYDYRYHGPVSLRRALACSYNLVAVKLLDDMGLDVWTQGVHRFGFTTLRDPDRFGLALTLGSGEVSLTELSAAYASLANGGQSVEPFLIERVLNADGDILYQHTPALPEQVVDPRVAFLVTDILSDDAARAPSFGAQSVLAQSFPAAVKTGTTTDWRDNWTVGYTPDLVVGVWVGNADNRPMRSISGVDGAAPIWHNVLAESQAWMTRGAATAFERPSGIVTVEVCAESGLLPGTACVHRRQELFLAERIPLRICDVNQWVDVDVRTGRLADAHVPPTYRRPQRVTLWTAELLTWASQEGRVSQLEFELLARSGSQAPAAPLALAVTPPDVERVVPRQVSGPQVLRPDDGSRYTLMSDLPLGSQQLVVEVAAEPGGGPVVLVVDDEPFHTWSSPPYRVVWPLTAGQHVFRAIQPERGGDASALGVSIHVFTSERISTEIGSAGLYSALERT